MVINNPEYFLLLIFLIPIIIISLYNYGHGKKSLQALGGQWRFEGIFNIFMFKSFFIYLSFIGFIIFTTLALADVRWEDQLIEDDRDGYEIVFVLDISRSMLADDVEPNRLKKCIGQINWLINSMENSRFGIVVFKGTAVPIIPVTDDFYGLSLFLNTVSPDIISVPGSHIENGLKSAVKQFVQAGKYRAILLFTDGENKSSGDPLEGARMAKEHGIPIIPVMFGTLDGGNIYTGLGHYLRDKEDQIVTSVPDWTILKKIAEISNGQVFHIDEVNKIKNKILSIAKQIENENVDKGLKLVKKEKYGFFLMIALLFLGLLLLIRSIQWENTV